MKKYEVDIDEQFGHRALNPVPSIDELNEFYARQYYESMKGTNGQMERFINHGDECIEELAWLQKTEYNDAYLIFKEYFNEANFLDIGCGTGEIIEFMNNKGFKTVGIEPSEIAYNKMKEKKIEAYNCDLYKFYEITTKKFDIINMTNVMEHMPNPVETLRICKNLLKDKGIIRIKVPNDFNELQLNVVEKLKVPKYWVSIPDHVSYFDFKSLEKLLVHEGFRIINKTVDFPMELFLLMGENYVNDNAIGRSCHEKRKKLELNLSDTLRRKMYSAFAEVGVGRNIIIYAVLG